jgi:hypothetical protein
MTLLVTSAAGANGAGYGKILAFADDGKPLGVFGTDPRIVDPRGLGSSRADGLLFVNSGSDRILALDRNGHVVHASRSIVGLNPGGGNFGPDGRYYVGLRGERTIMAFARKLDGVGEYVLPPHVVPFPRGFAFGRVAGSFSPPASDQAGRAITPFWGSIPITGYCLHGRLQIRNSVRSTLRSRLTAISSSAVSIRSVRQMR